MSATPSATFTELSRTFAKTALAVGMEAGLACDTAARETEFEAAKTAVDRHVAKLESIARFVRTWGGHSRSCAAEATPGAPCNCGFRTITQSADELLGPDPTEPVRVTTKRPVRRLAPSTT